MCHFDDDKTNSELRNLSWGSRSKNGKDAVRNGRKKMTYAQANSLRERYAHGERTADLADYFGISQRQTYNIINGRQYVAHG